MTALVPVLLRNFKMAERLFQQKCATLSDIDQRRYKKIDIFKDWRFAGVGLILPYLKPKLSNIYELRLRVTRGSNPGFAPFDTLKAISDKITGV